MARTRTRFSPSWSSTSARAPSTSPSSNSATASRRSRPPRATAGSAATRGGSHRRRRRARAAARGGRGGEDRAVDGAHHEPPAAPSRHRTGRPRRNETIPTKRPEIFTTHTDDQPTAVFHVVEGERQDAARNRTLAVLELALPPLPEACLRTRRPPLSTRRRWNGRPRSSAPPAGRACAVSPLRLTRLLRAAAPRPPPPRPRPRRSAPRLPGRGPWRGPAGDAR
uniref:Hsp70 family protein n=1 Tax=Streptomyces triticirhizae TaxID=2483353 RepID=UPI001F3D646D